MKSPISFPPVAPEVLGLSSSGCVFSKSKIIESALSMAVCSFFMVRPFVACVWKLKHITAGRATYL